MKKLLLITATLCLFIGFNSCKKDKKEESVNQLEKSYFTIQNASFVSNAFPSASQGSAPSITSVYGNSSVLEGGSNPISIITSSSIKEVLVGVQGKSGYYKINSSDLKSTSPTYMVYLLFSSDFTEDTFTILISIVDANGLISPSQTVTVTRVTAGTGKLQISCSWDKQNDIDLHLVEPNSSEIYWDNDESSNGGLLDVDSNPACSIDNINNENITYSANATVEKGKYIVRIALFSSCDITDLTHYVVTARMDGAILTPLSGKNPYYGTVEAANAYIDGDGPREGVTVMEFNVSATKSKSIDNQKMLKFSYPKHPNLVKESLLYR